MSQELVVDYSFSRPSLSAIKGAGYVGAIRYLAPLPNQKVVSPAEAQSIWAAGLDLTLVWESYAQSASGGRSVGAAEGAEALAQANALPWPSNRPIYFVMEDPNVVPQSTWPQIEAYCEGLGDAGIPPSRRGGYGSQALIEHLLSIGAITFGWQVEDWSSSVSSMCRLYQRSAPTLAPASLVGSIDEDAVLQGDWGQWNPSSPGDAVVTPPPLTPLNKPVVGAAVTPSGRGYWLAGADGGVFTHGDATFFGSMGGKALNAPVVGMAATPSGKGYWLVAQDGGVFSFGDAAFDGSTGGMKLNKPVVGMASHPSSGGYWLVAADGGIFSFDAPFFGSMGGKPLNQPVVGMCATSSGNGYWLIARDGGVFCFGDAAFDGSEGGKALNKPVVGMASTPSGKGYWLVAGDGGIFTFGDAAFYGSAAEMTLNAPVVGVGAPPLGDGYWLFAADGGVFTYGNAVFEGAGA